MNDDYTVYTANVLNFLTNITNSEREVIKLPPLLYMGRLAIFFLLVFCTMIAVKEARKKVKENGGCKSRKDIKNLNKLCLKKGRHDQKQPYHRINNK